MIQGSILFCPAEQLNTAAQFREFLKEHKYNWNLLLINHHSQIESRMKALIHDFFKGQSVQQSYILLVNEVNSLIQDFQIGQDHAAMVSDLLVEVEWIIEDEIHDSKAYLKDQLLAYSTLISSYLPLGVASDVNWIDARDYIITDDTYGNPDLIKTRPLPIQMGQQFVSQMFLGASTENNSTLLREEQKLNCYWNEVLT